MPVPRAVVFDLGKVLLDFDYGRAAANIARMGKISASEVRKFIDQSPLLFRFETGLISREEFYSEVCSFTGFGGDLEQFSRIFGDIFEPIPAMIELHAALGGRNVPTFIFSNTNELAVRHITAQYPFFSRFQDYILSYQHGAMKPQMKLYEAVERAATAAGGEILYIDDRAENVAAGAERGWRVILHESPEKSFEQVRQAGLLV